MQQVYKGIMRERQKKDILKKEIIEMSKYIMGCDLATPNGDVSVFQIYDYDVVGQPRLTDTKMIPVITEKGKRNRKREILRKKLKKVNG